MQATTCCPTYPNEPAARLCQSESANIWPAAAFAHHQPAQGFRQRRRDLPAQLGLADGYGGDDLIEDMRGDAAQGGFYFGEFGHGWGLGMFF